MSLSKTEVLEFGLDTVVIRNYIAGIIGGKALDTTDYTPDYIKAGHVVIRDTKTDTYKPMPVNSDGAAYSTLPSDHEYAGFVVSTVKTDEPLAGIMYAGEINDEAVPYPITDIATAIKAALPQISFYHD